MTTTVYNPFPQLEATPTWQHGGVCYSRVMYATREEAELVGAHVRATGGTVNGGWFHGRPLGQVTEAQGGWEVTY